jgi:hypothetical protein
VGTPSSTGAASARTTVASVGPGVPTTAGVDADAARVHAHD